RLRQARGMTLTDLARATGKTKGYLSKLERSDRLPPFTTLGALAHALGVELDEFLKAPPAPLSPLPAPATQPRRQGKVSSRNIDIHRGGAAGHRFVAGEAYAYLPLVQQYRGKYMSPFLMKLPPGKSWTFTHDAEEFTYVLEGAVHLIYEQRTHKLSAGDGFYL